MTITFTVLVLTAGIAQAQFPGPAPTFSVVQSTAPNKGQVVLTRIVKQQEQIAVSEKSLENGDFVERVRIITRVVDREVSVVYELGNSRVITPKGKQLPIDEVWRRLKKSTVVAVSGDSNLPAPIFLRALNPQTLVIIPAPLKPIPFPK
ncbi:MAG: hypothetical protein HYX68_24875 [Planctomycetes bacterium]|jgi:hypothetical protein|nr:hypothetical protein [Planctomycetota bacterium]